MIATNEERQAPTRLDDVEPTHLERYQFALKYILKGGVVLDAPCGSGYGSAVLASKAGKVCGVDNNSGAIDHAKEFFSCSNTSFQVNNVEDMLTLFPESIFDQVVNFEGIEHLHNPLKFLAEARRVLNNKGSLIISTPRKPHGSKYHVTEYSLKEFKDLLSPYFNIQVMFGQVSTKIFNLKDNPVSPQDYSKFNFIAHCTPK